MISFPLVTPVAGVTPPPALLPSDSAGGSQPVSGSTMCIVDDYLAEIIITARIAQRIASVQRLYEVAKDGCFSQVRLDFALNRQQSCERDLNTLGLHLRPDGDLAWIHA